MSRVRIPSLTPFLLPLCRVGNVASTHKEKSMKKKDELRDIYQSENPDFEKDFTPQVAQEVVEQRQRDLRKRRLTTIFFGVAAVLLAVVVVALVIRDVLSSQTVDEPIPVENKAYIPRHS